jgi:hypothetical protein
MYYFPITHLKMPLEEIYNLWQTTYLDEHKSRPSKNTVSVRRHDLAVFEDIEWVQRKGLKPISAFFSVTPPRSHIPPHKDPSSNPEVIKSGYVMHPCALNIPLVQDLGTKICWHKVKTGHVTKLEGAENSPYNNVRVPMAEMDDLIEVASVCLDRPMLINTSEWHSVENNTDSVRLAFSLRFDPVAGLPEIIRVFAGA